MCSMQDNPQNALIDVFNQQQTKAKRSLYEIGEFEDEIYLQTYQENQQDLKNKDTVQKWALTQNNHKYQKFSETFYNQNLEIQKTKNKNSKKQVKTNKNTNKDKQKDKKQDKFKNKQNIQLFPKLRKQKVPKNQTIHLQKRLSCRPIEQTMISINQLFDINQNIKQKSANPKAKRSQTPIVQSNFPIKPSPILNSYRQTYSALRQNYKNQRSMSGALSIIKKQTQTQSIEKQNRKVIPVCRLNEKQTQKIRSQWMQFQKYPSLKAKDLMNLACIDFCTNY